MNEIHELLKDHRVFHSEFQILNFVLGEMDNDWSRYQQALKEIKGRYDGLQDLKCDLKLAQIAFKALKKKKPWFGTDRKTKYRVRLAKQARVIRNMEATAKDTERELRIFMKVAYRLRSEKFKCLTEDQKRNLDAQMWFEKAKTLAAVDIHTMGRLSPVTVNFIRQLPVKMRLEVAELIHPDNVPGLIAWLMLNGTDRDLIE